MRIIKPFVELIDEQDLFKRIEKAGRTCYKSESKITEDSAYPFFQGICKRGHESVLEHSNIIVRTHTPETYLKMVMLITEYTSDTGVPHYIRYTQYYNEDDGVYTSDEYSQCYSTEHILSGNVRAWRNIARRFRNEDIIVSLFSKHPAFYDVFTDEANFWNNCDTVNNDIEIVSEEDILDSDYFERHAVRTVRVVANRGVVDEFARHRAFAHSVESTRYCNYTKDNVTDDGCVFIYPSWYFDKNVTDELLHTVFYNICKDSDDSYVNMMNRTKTPQIARGALNLWVKSEQVMTGTIEQWRAFIKLRDSSKAHPDAQQAAQMIKEVLNL